MISRSFVNFEPFFQPRNQEAQPQSLSQQSANPPHQIFINMEVLGQRLTFAKTLPERLKAPMALMADRHYDNVLHEGYKAIVGQALHELSDVALAAQELAESVYKEGQTQQQSGRSSSAGPLSRQQPNHGEFPLSQLILSGQARSRLAPPKDNPVSSGFIKNLVWEHATQMFQLVLVRPDTTRVTILSGDLLTHYYGKDFDAHSMLFPKMPTIVEEVMRRKTEYTYMKALMTNKVWTQHFCGTGCRRFNTYPQSKLNQRRACNGCKMVRYHNTTDCLDNKAA